MDNNTKIENLLDYIRMMKAYRLSQTYNGVVTDVLSAYSYGYDKGALSELEFIENILKR